VDCNLDFNTCFDYNIKDADSCSDEDSVEIIFDAHINSPAAAILLESLNLTAQPGSKPSRKSKKSSKGKSNVRPATKDLDPAKHPIGWFSDEVLEEYVQIIYKEVLEPLAQKSPQLVYLMHTSNRAEQAAAVYALVSTNKGHFHGAKGSQYFRYKLGDLIICHGIHKAIDMIRERLLSLQPTASMVNLASRIDQVKLRRAKWQDKPETKRARTIAKYGDHGASAAIKALDYSTEVADKSPTDQHENPQIAPEELITIAELVEYLTKHVIVSSAQRKEICANTINQGSADGPSIKEWKLQKSQRGNLSASTIADYTGVLLKTKRLPKGFDAQILRNCRAPGDFTDADDHQQSESDKAIAAACKAGQFLLRTDNPLQAGHAWEPVAGAHHKTYLMALAKETHQASPNYDKSLWPQVMNSIHVQNCGLLIHEKFNFLCYSPDRSAYCVKEGKLIFAEFKLLFKYLGYTLDEIADQFIEGMEKNPGPTKTLLGKFCLQPVYYVDQAGTQRWLKNLSGHYEWIVNRNHAYFYQCIAGLNIGNRDVIDFVAITGASTNGVFIERIYRSEFVTEWKKTELFAEYLFCNQILQHLTKPLSNGTIRPAVASFEQFTIEKAVIGSNDALTWDKLMNHVKAARVLS